MLRRRSLYLYIPANEVIFLFWAAERPAGFMLAACQVSPCWASQDFCVAKSLSTLKATPLFGRQADCPARPFKRWAWQRLGASASNKFAPLFHLLTGCSAAQRGVWLRAAGEYSGFRLVFNPLAPMLSRGSLYLCAGPRQIWVLAWAAGRPEGLMFAACQVSPCWASQDFCLAKRPSTLVSALKATPLLGRQADCPARPVKRWAWQRLGASASNKFAPLFHLLTGCSATQRGNGLLAISVFLGV